MTHGLGYIKDAPDDRDYLFKVAAPKKLPAKVDLVATGKFPAVYDQGQLGSCTANAASAALAYMADRPLPLRARLEIYYNARSLMGAQYVSQDSGTTIRNTFKGLNQVGARPEDDWPYDITKFAQAPVPTLDPLSEKLIQYERVDQTETALKTALASGYPVVFGFTAFEGLESAATARTGAIPLPKPGQQPIGGHAVVAVGYYGSGKNKRIKIRNSWGEGWGKGGYGSLPLSYVLDPKLAGDFWIVKAF
jgi:C1A family cysteine protease